VTAALSPTLFPEAYACPTCAGDGDVPEDPTDPGNGWRLPCPVCYPGYLQAPWYDPEHADIPY
jgi:hypothetical protein